MAENTEKMVLKEFIAAVQEKADSKLSKTAIKDVIYAISDVITEQVAKKKQITLPGVATFRAVLRESRDGFNPMTGRKITIPDKMIVKCRINQAFKTKVAGR